MTAPPVSVGVATFGTALGVCGLAWGERGITTVALPGPSSEDPLAYLSRVDPEAAETTPPAGVARVIERIVAMLAGARDDLADVPLDLAGVSEFAGRVYAVARTIPPGQTMTYGEVAAAIGEPGSARAVGHALGENPVPILVPCHRVLAAGGGIGGFSAPGGAGTKRRMLLMEGAGEAGLFGAEEIFGSV